MAIVKEEYFTEPVNPHFLIWLKAMNKKVGDTYEIHEFQIWISEKELTFKKLNGLNHYQGITLDENGISNFTSYLESFIN